MMARGGGWGGLGAAGRRPSGGGTGGGGGAAPPPQRGVLVHCRYEGTWICEKRCSLVDLIPMMFLNLVPYLPFLMFSEGKSRSVTFVLAYLMLTQRWTLKQALNHVR